MNSQSSNLHQQREDSPDCHHPEHVAEERIPRRPYKIIFLGDVAVGKSSLISRICSNEFKKETSTISPQLSTCDFLLNMDSCTSNDPNINNLNNEDSPSDKNKFIRITTHIWDTAGQERFGSSSIPAFLFRGVHGLVIVFDVCNENSFKNCTKWLNKFHEFSSTEKEKDSNSSNNNNSNNNNNNTDNNNANNNNINPSDNNAHINVNRFEQNDPSYSPLVSIPVLLIGSKTDVDPSTRAINDETAREFVLRSGWPWIGYQACSSKSGKGVLSAIDKILCECEKKFGVPNTQWGSFNDQIYINTSILYKIGGEQAGLQLSADQENTSLNYSRNTAFTQSKCCK